MSISGCTVKNVQATSLIFPIIFFFASMVGFRTQKYGWERGGWLGGGM